MHMHTNKKMTSSCGHFPPGKKAYFLHNKMFKFLNIYKNIVFKRTTKGPILSVTKVLILSISACFSDFTNFKS